MRRNHVDVTAAGAQAKYDRNERQAVTRVEIAFDALPSDTRQAFEERLDRYRQLKDDRLPAIDHFSAADRMISFQLGNEHALSPLADQVPRLRDHARSLLRELVEGLRVLHDAGLGALHLGPELVFVSDNFERVVIIPALWLQPPLTEDMSVGVSKLPRVAPELFRNDVSISQPEVDLYALGALLWRVLSGAPRDLNGGIHFSEACPEIPQAKEWDAMLDGCLRANPARRFKRLDEVLEALGSNQPVEQAASIPETVEGGPRRGKLIAGLAVIGVVVVIALTWMQTSSGGPELGFANTVIRYADRDYKGAGWSEVRAVASVSRAAQGNFGPLYTIDGIDTKNYWVADKGGKVFKVKDGQWEFMGALDGGQWPRIAALDGDTAFISSQYYQANSKFFVVAPDGTRGFDIQRSVRAWPTIIASDYVLLTKTDYWKRPHAYRYQSGTFKELEPDKEISALVHRDDNTPLTDFHSGFIIEPAVFETRETAYALWAKFDRALKPMIVRFKQGLWVTVEELDAVFDTRTHDSIKAAWFGRNNDEIFVVIAGNAGRVVLHRIGGGTFDHTITSAGTTTSLELIAVWGVSPEKYWVMDSNGSVWERQDNRWRTVVRGLYDNDVRFRGAWVTPEGAVFAITDDKLYRLN